MTEITAHHGLFKDTNLHVEDTGGNGRPVVLIHGWPLSGESWSASRSRRCRRPATGSSPTTAAVSAAATSRSTGYDYDTLTEDLHAVLTELDLQRRHAGRVLDGRRRGRPLRHQVRRRAAAQRRLRLRGAAVPAADRRQPRRPARPRTPAAEMTAGLTKRPGRVLRRVHHRVLLGRRRAEGDRGAAAGRPRAASRPTKQAALAAWRRSAPPTSATTCRRSPCRRSSSTATATATVPFEGSGERTHAAIAGASCT